MSKYLKVEFKRAILSKNAIIVFIITLMALIIAYVEANGIKGQHFLSEYDAVYIFMHIRWAERASYLVIIAPLLATLVFSDSYLLSIGSWLDKYRCTKVVRCNSTPTRVKASNWAQKYYVNGPGKNLSYKPSINTKSLSSTYCSKLVWQSYYYGANFTFKIMQMSPQGDRVSYITPNDILPYHFINSYNLNYNGFKIVKSCNW